jgi:hypothetical protein
MLGLYNPAMRSIRIQRRRRPQSFARGSIDRRALSQKSRSRSEVEAAWLRGSVPKPVSSAPLLAATSHAERDQRIREAAYFNAQRRGFAPGGELEDWLAAEAVLPM